MTTPRTADTLTASGPRPARRAASCRCWWRAIYVRQGFDPANREHQSTMVRQLVHFLLALGGRSQICRGVLIQEARQIESYWRVAHNLPPLSASPLGMLLESCGPGPT